jgi:hypothetical protein
MSSENTPSEDRIVRLWRWFFRPYFAPAHVLLIVAAAVVGWWLG